MSKTIENADYPADLTASAIADLRLVEEIMSGLGVTSETIQKAMDLHSPACVPRVEIAELTDDEWSVIGPYLPEEPRQANTMGNRQFFNAVLAAMGRDGSWGDHRKAQPYSDAVRRRFGRWAHQGVWQRLAIEIAEGNLRSDRKAIILATAERAERLRRKGQA